MELAQADAELRKPILAGRAPLRAEVVYSARYEMAATIEDVLARRTGMQLYSWKGCDFGSAGGWWDFGEGSWVGVRRVWRWRCVIMLGGFGSFWSWRGWREGGAGGRVMVGADFFVLGKAGPSLRSG